MKCVPSIRLIFLWYWVTAEHKISRIVNLELPLGPFLLNSCIKIMTRSSSAVKFIRAFINISERERESERKNKPVDPFYHGGNEKCRRKQRLICTRLPWACADPTPWRATLAASQARQPFITRYAPLGLGWLTTRIGFSYSIKPVYMTLLTII